MSARTPTLSSLRRENSRGIRVRSLVGTAFSCLETNNYASAKKEIPVGSDAIKAKPCPSIRTSSDSTTTDRPLTFLRFPSVRARTGLSRSTIWRLERQGSFPRHRRISRNAVAWLETEIADWMRSKVGVEPRDLGDGRV